MRVLLASVVLGVAGLGCSPVGGWFGQGKDGDAGVLGMRSNRRVNLRCSNVDLSSNQIDVPTFRKLVSCFNSNGTLDPMEKLTLRMTDRDLEPLMRVVNESVLSNHKLLYELDQTFDHWVQRAYLRVAFYQLGRVLENEQFVASGVWLLRSAYRALPDRGLFLEGIANVAPHVTAENARGLFDAAISVAEARAVEALRQKFMARSGAGLTHADVAKALVTFLHESRPGTQGLMEDSFKAVANGSLFKALDAGVGVNDSDLQRSLPAIAAALSYTMDDGGRRLDPLTSLFGALTKPIPCLAGARRVRDPVDFVIGEMTGKYRDDPVSYIWRQGPLALVAMNSFCTYPPELETHYGAMKELALAPGFRGLSELLRGLHENGLVPLFTKLLGDVGVDGKGGVKHLIPVLAEAARRELLDDGVLSIGLIRPEDRQGLSDAAQFMIDPIRGPGSKNFASVISDGLGGIEESHLSALLQSMERFLETDEAVIAPALRDLRLAMYVNGVHPMMDLAQEMLARAPRDEALFESVFKMSEQPEFQDSVRLISDMAKDGRLIELYGSILTLFHGLAVDGYYGEIPQTEAPAFVRRTRHDWASVDDFYLKAKPTAGETPNAATACGDLRFLMKMSETNSAGYDAHLDSFLQCLDQERDHSGLVRFVRYLKCDRSPRPGEPCAGAGLRGGDYYRLVIDLVRDLDMGTENVAELSRAWLASIVDGRFDRVLKASVLPGARVFDGGTVMQAAGEMLGAVFEKVKAPIQRLLNVGADIFERRDLYRAVRFFDVVRKGERDPEPREYSYRFDTQRLRTRVHNKECFEDEAKIAERIEEAHDDYLHSISGREWLGGKERRTWQFEEFKNLLKPVVHKLADPALSAPDRNVVDGLLNILKYFSLKPGETPSRGKHWQPEELYRFLRERSDDAQMVSYFYPGEDLLRVRLVNTLDRLELVLVNADIEIPGTPNTGMKLLARVAMAWGDEPRELWPEPIKRFYGSGAAPTLADAYHRMSATIATIEKRPFNMGYPYRPVCDQWPDPTDKNLEWYAGTGRPRVSLVTKRKLFNLRQLLSVVEENLPGAPGPHAGGMKVLRNLLYELYVSNPGHESTVIGSEEYLNGWAKAGMANNLRVASGLVEAGLLRQISRYMREMPRLSTDRNSLSDRDRENLDSTLGVLKSLIETSATPGTSELIRSVAAAAPEEGLIWNVVKRVFEVMDTGTPEEIASLKQGAFYAIASLKKLDMTETASRALAPAIRAHGPFLARHADSVIDLVIKKDSARLMRSLYETPDTEGGLPVFREVAKTAMADSSRVNDALTVLETIDTDVTAKAAWDRLSSRYDLMTESDEWKSLEFGDIVDDFFDYFSKGPGTPEGKTVWALQNYMIRRSRAGPTGASDALDLLSLMARNPDEFDRLMRTMGGYIDSGEMSDFVHMAERALRE